MESILKRIREARGLDNIPKLLGVGADGELPSADRDFELEAESTPKKKQKKT